ncbi:sensor histidine kinase [Sphingobacterium sp. LRF_L2]|uniref:sensor histidine kinase n=1 Tax=Sphingobacterium sp. LRF_L2 TaxID=3369421 RepID=UPI003F61E3C1
MMFKKYNLLLAVIILTAAGIMLVLSFWLYGSYKSERELFIGTAERSLFNVLQNYYQKEFSENGKLAAADSADSNRRHRGLMMLLNKVYPDLDLKPLQYVLDTSDVRRWRGRKSPENERNKEESNQLLPLYLLEKMDFNAQLLDTLEPRLARALQRNGIQIGFQLTTEVINRDKFEHFIEQRAKKGELITRPILINPGNEQFLIAKFENPFPYLLIRLTGQILFSLLLLTAFTGTFLYLFKTIRRQNQLAILRKAFVNNMTHELKTPVATVMAAVEAIQRFVASDDKVRMNKYLDISKSELEHLSNMIERVLQLDVDETHRIRVVKRPFDLIAVVRNTLETARIGTKKSVEMTCEAKEDVLMFAADEAHIKNVLSNLLDNAIKYSSREPVKIKILIEENEEAVFIAVIDQGDGIEATHVDSIFDMFYRVPQGNLHNVKGFGLGLAYVKHVVEQHGGSIRVKSEFGKGSTFKIKIPKK